MEAYPETRHSLTLTSGLFRNTIFNVFGWIWPTGLSLISIPIILNGLGTDAFGVLSIGIIISSYLNLISNPISFGNIRFMAEAFGNEDWLHFNHYWITGLLLAFSLASIITGFTFFAADFLSRIVFKIDQFLLYEATIAFRIIAFIFFFNSITTALRSIPSAMRRYETQNIGNIIIGTINALGMILAVYEGWGLLGVIYIQLFASILGFLFFSGYVFWLIKNETHGITHFFLDWTYIKKFLIYSLYLFGGQTISGIGIQMDRILVGVLLGNTSVTYYTIPTKITDNISGLIERLSIALYPLSAESLASGRIGELAKLYTKMIRWMLLIISFIATILAISSTEILDFWVGPDISKNSYLIFIILALSHISRSAGGICSNVLNGLGKADFNLRIGFLTFVCNLVPMMILVPKYGLIGMALSIFIGMLVSNLLFDIFTQRIFLKQLNWRIIFKPYFKVLIIASITFGLSSVTIFPFLGWLVILVRSFVFSLIFISLALLIKLLKVNEIVFVLRKIKYLRK
jgi:O-antigen/teichoic acid export membrane protein